MLNKQGYMHTRPGTRKHARAHARTHTCNIAFVQQQRFANAPQCYIVRTLAALLYFQDDLLFAGELTD